MKRYDFHTKDGGRLDMRISEHDGDWVRYEDIKHLLSAAPEAARTMDSAPKDGTPILGFVPSYYQGKGGWAVVLWLAEKGMREAGWMDNRAFLTKPSCWLPLPPAPQHGEQPISTTKGST